jgi:hypothetical protein
VQAQILDAPDTRASAYVGLPPAANNPDVKTRVSGQDAQGFAHGAVQSNLARPSFQGSQGSVEIQEKRHARCRSDLCRDVMPALEKMPHF